MAFEKKTIKFARTKRGIPSLWQNRKDFATMIRYTYILDSEGNPKDPIYIKKDGNTDSRLVPIHQDDLILKVFFDDQGEGVSVLRLCNINPYSNIAEVEVVYRKPSGQEEWNHNPSASPIVSNETMKRIDSVIKNIIVLHS